MEQSQSQTSDAVTETVGDISVSTMVYNGAEIKLTRVGCKLGLSLDGQQVFTCSLFPERDAPQEDEIDGRAGAQDE